MKALRFPVLVFLLVFLCGLTAVLWTRTPPREVKSPQRERRTTAVKNLPPLKLPAEGQNRRGTEGWEFTGEIAANFVTARGKLHAELLHQSWRPEKTVFLESSLCPSVLLTYSKGDLELVLMLWKIDTGKTGCSYKREKIIKPGVETI